MVFPDRRSGDVDKALAGFKLSRQIEPDGSVGHLLL